MRALSFVFASFVGSALLAGSASAHVSLASGPAQANKSQIITFGVGHGCETADGRHLDTLKIRISIPAGVTSVRGLYSDLGKPTVVRSGATVTHVEWTKATAEALADDDAYYEVKLRAKTPDAAFTKLKFSVEQTCHDPVANAPVVVNWDADEGSSTGSPAPFLVLTPTHGTGWNKIKVARAVSQDDVPTYLGDAAIVWRGTQAYSSNANTAAMITATQGVTALAGGLAVNDEIWVRY